MYLHVDFLSAISDCGPTDCCGRSIWVRCSICDDAMTLLEAGILWQKVDNHFQSIA